LEGEYSKTHIFRGTGWVFWGVGFASDTHLVGVAGVTHYEVKQISNARTHKGQRELWEEWKGYENCWVYRDVLMADVPTLMAAFDTRLSTFQAPKVAPEAAPKRAQ